MVLITHEMDVVRGVADTVAQLDHGRIVEHGTVADVVRSSDSPLSRALLPSPPSAWATDAPGVWQLRYERADVDPAWLSAVSRELDTNIAVLSGLIETVGGVTAGRVVVRVDAGLPDQQLEAAFAARGVRATRGDTAGAELDLITPRLERRAA
jgi:D-methionine transport system ATP-binding protein